MELLINEIDGKKAGVMAPIPQYPLYSAVISKFNMHLVSYILVVCKSESLISLIKSHCWTIALSLV